MCRTPTLGADGRLQPPTHCWRLVLACLAAHLGQAREGGGGRLLVVSGVGSATRQQRQRRREPPLLEVYYESLCPDSIKFINYTLREVWANAEFRAAASLRLYPFGNARLVPEVQVSKGYHFWHPNATYPLVLCQHGDQECLGNRIQACAIHLLKPEVHVPFVVCMVSYGNRAGVELSSFACGTTLKIDMASIKACAESQQGYKLHLEYGETSLAPELNRGYVPYVVINGEHVVAAENGDLKGPLCKVIAGSKPAACAAVGSHNGSNTSNGAGCGDDGHGGSGKGF